MNYLEMPSFKPIKSLPVIRLIINSFTGNKKEVQRSEDIMRILKTKNYKISEVMDINQELIFDKDKKLNKHIRDHFHKIYKLHKINSNFSVPEIKIGDDLVISYDEFIILNESGILDKIMSGLICTHVRIYENEIVYLPSTLDEFSYCIYCYSNKKKKQMITLIANIRDYNDEENNDIFNFIEANNVTVKLVDYENYLKQEEELDKNLDIFQLVDKKEKVFLINHEVFPISVFFEVIEKRILSSMGNSTCCLCGKKLNLYIDNYKCISCLCSDDTLGNPNAKCNQQIQHGNQIKNKRINNPYHFVQKLKLNLKQFYYPSFSQEYRKHIPAIFN